jgi:hypothetical protein
MRKKNKERKDREGKEERKGKRKSKNFFQLHTYIYN